MSFLGRIQAQGAQNKNAVLITVDGSISSQIAITMVSQIAQYELTYCNAVDGIVQQSAYAK